MSYKKSEQSEGKTSYVEVAAIGKKATWLKTSHHGKIGKHGFKPKLAVAAMKSKATYRSHMPSSLKIHDAGAGVKFPDVAPVGLETNLPEGETELAEQLVAKLADDSADVTCCAKRISQTGGVGAVDWILAACAGGMGEWQAAESTSKKTVARSAAFVGCASRDCKT